MIKELSVSMRLPKAISKYLDFSLSVHRAEPSARLQQTEKEDLRICDVMLYFSVEGKDSVTSLIFRNICLESFQTSRVSKLKVFNLCGYVVIWLCGDMVIWLFGYLVMWLCGYAVIWLCGYLVIWLCGY